MSQAADPSHRSASESDAARLAGTVESLSSQVGLLAGVIERLSSQVSGHTEAIAELRGLPAAVIALSLIHI
eukprot:3099880-Alexandrium_andersonii.AAC.1